jgi:hypothetical protein
VPRAANRSSPVPAASTRSSDMSWYNPIDDAEAAGSAVKSVFTSIGDTASATENIAEHVLAAGEWMADPHNWLRVLYVVSGTMVALMGLYLAAKNTPVGSATATGAKLAAVA